MTRPSIPRRRLVVVLLGLGALLVPLLLTPPPAGADQADSPTYRVAAASIAGSEYSTCVVQEDGLVRCWGPNDRGQLGVPRTKVANIGATTRPDQHPPLALGGRVRAVSMGNSFGCALLENGRVRCWGYNVWGQLGQGTNADTTDLAANEVPLVNLGPGRTARAISAGHSTVCAILDTGQVRCWGFNGAGNLGIGNVDPVSESVTPDQIPTVKLGAGRTARALAVGARHSCALLDNGTVRCWGGNANRQLGQGNADSYVNRTPDAIPAVSLGRRATGISAGDDHTCAILDNGELRCWGKNDNAQLGLGHDKPVTTVPSTGGPVQLGAGRRAVVTASGVDSSCAATQDNVVMCWGPVEPLGRTQVPWLRGTFRFPLPVRSLATHRDSMCGAMVNGQVACAGLNDSGQLGQGNGKAHKDVVVVPLGARAKVRARTALSQRVLPARDRKRPYVFAFTGRVVGVFAPDHVTCAGTVTVVVRKGRKVVGQGRATLRPDNGGCVYGVRVTTHRKKRGNLVATSTYSGNINLTPSGTRVRVRAG